MVHWFFNAFWTLYSLSIACADGNKSPGGFFLKIISLPLSEVIKKVGLDCPPTNCLIEIQWFQSFLYYQETMLLDF